MVFLLYWRFVQFYTTEEESEDQSDIVKATFRAWDIDRNGKLSKREFFSVPRKWRSIYILRYFKSMTIVEYLICNGNEVYYDE